MFGLFLSFLAFLCLALLPQVDAIPVVPSSGANPDGQQNSSDTNSEQVDGQQQQGQQNDEEQEEIGHGSLVIAEEVEEEPGPSVQTTLMPDTCVSPWPCQTKYWCMENDGKGLEILMEWEKTIVTPERVQNLKQFKPGQRVSRKKLHDAGKTLEKQLAEIAKNKEKNRCMFECVYCGGEYENLVELKEHVVGVKHKNRYWRVQCVERLDLDEIENKLKIGLSIYPRIFPWAKITYDGIETLSCTDDRVPLERRTQWIKHMVDYRTPSCRPLPGVRAAYEPEARPTQACALEPRK
ncbi:uncharacterized protein LOC107370465 [Tetranychus urticae]|uniref:uncharacterized protein LOC107370465 n=1 Tax=Tetranychus urticae TaxID=32264 RepID=UPI00077BA2EC|nr:uncharacterized protein LOC107370465 [Tetranychus urticae]